MGAASNSGVKNFVCKNGQCFVAGTKVKTIEGDVNIEEIQEGDYVYSKNVLTGEKGYKEVKQTFVNETDKLIILTINGETIETTEKHPFWLEGIGFVDAGELKEGDKVHTADSNTTRMDKVVVRKLEEKVKVYNFEVEDWHTYYVGECGVLVHNDCPYSWSNEQLQYATDSTHSAQYGGKIGRVKIG